MMARRWWALSFMSFVYSSSFAARWAEGGPVMISA